ncbi:MAG: biopolymer transport protein ExbB [Thermotogaceae bacterium]|jgi:biopolymer transport protein ExbB/TolQ|nr:biopolymer transport protein ExbB [Thermotogaceae bacterium]
MSYLDIIKTGGPIIIVIFITAALGLFFFFERLIMLSTIKSGMRTGAENPFLSSLNSKINKTRSRNADEIQEIVGLHCEKLYKNFRIITTTATISPLLGLLGTTTGMIKIFNTIEQTEALKYADELATGIGEALYTTIAGLIVAIALTILLGFIKEMATGIRHDLTDYYVMECLKTKEPTKRMI